MAQRSIKARAAAIDGFAAVLRDLRDSVGTPSFREMSGRSHAISHTTLHEAAQGNRLPSWATTVEFVRACSADPADYRDRWEQAERVVRSVGTPEPSAPVSAPVRRTVIDVAIPDTDAAGETTPAETQPTKKAVDSGEPGLPTEDPAPANTATSEPGKRPRRRYLIPALAAAVILAATGITVGVLAATSDNKAMPSSEASPSAIDCPVAQPNPPYVPPAARGDKGAFITDVTLPDCSHIARGETVMKVWRFKNVGRVPWVRYSLHRLDMPQKRNQCQTINDIPMRSTAPGQEVNVQTEITAPDSRAFCFVRFKMENAAGKIAFPGSRPVYFQLIVG